MTDTRAIPTKTTSRLRHLLLTLLALAMLAAACSSDDSTASVDDGLFAENRGDSSVSSDRATGDGGTDLEAPAAEAQVDQGAQTDEEDSFSSQAPSSIAPAPATGGALYDSDGTASASGEVAEGSAQSRAIQGDDAEGLFAPPAGQEDEYLPPPDDSRLRDNRFANYGYRQFIAARDDALSTFALDVDTGSYTVARRWLDEGMLPPPDAVRVEEFVNAFDYDYRTPRRGLEVSVDGGPSPFDDRNILVRVGVQAEKIAAGERPPVALTFIVDTSGSMDQDNRLGLVKDSLEILVDELDDDDTVAIVVYSSNSGVLLEPTRVRDSRRIYDAIDSLRPGGSTNLESGLREGYALASRAFRSDGVNRVIIASDGVANAGITDQNQLSEYIRGYADEGIHLVTVGYGMGNYNDTLMEQLADNGDGFYAYVDTIDEARRLFQDELTSTLITAAIDAKIQVEFDPDIVDEYRLIGFENRGVRDSDFRNNAVDAGELGAGHQVTAMYEIRLQRNVNLDTRGAIGEVFLRWQDPKTGEVVEINDDINLRDIATRFGDTAADFQLATVVTAFGDVLRDNPYADDVNLHNILVEADRLATRMNSDKVDELVRLLTTADRLS